MEIRAAGYIPWSRKITAASPPDDLSITLMPGKGTVRLLRSREIEPIEPFFYLPFFTDVAFSTDGSLLAAGSIQGLHLVRTQDCSLISSNDRYLTSLRTMATSLSRKTTVLNIHEVATGNLIASFRNVPHDPQDLKAIAFSTDQRHLTAGFH